MKKRKHMSMLLTVIMLFTVIVNTSIPSIVAEDNIVVKVDGEPILFDQPPQLINGRTMVPLRAIFEKLGATVNWEPATETITAVKGDTTIVLKVGSTTATVNNEAKTLDSPAVIINSRTLVPARFVSESLNCIVNWDAATQTVSITTGPVEPETFVEIECKEDAFVRAGSYSEKNFGAEKSIELKDTPDKEYLRKGLLKFDASHITNPNITNAKIRLYVKDMQSSGVNTTVIAYASDTDDWNENTVKWDGSPNPKEKIGSKKMKDLNTFYEIDITEYVKQELAGDKIISVVLGTDIKQNLRIDFDSKEGTNKPVLILKYGGVPDPVEPEDEPLKPGEIPEVISKGQNPVEYAKKILSESTATGSGEVPKSAVKISDKEIHYPPVAATYVRDGEHANKNFAGEASVAIKQEATVGMNRRTFLKFDLRDLEASTVGGAFLKVYCNLMHDGKETNNIVATKVDNNWEENTITWSNAPKAGTVITTTNIKGTGQWFYFDLTSYVNEKLSSDKIVSLSLEDISKQAVRIEFESRGTVRQPLLIVMEPGAKGGTVPMSKVAGPIEEDDKYNYIMVGVNKNKAPRTEYTPMKTRILSSLPGFTPQTTKPALSKYGGLLSKKVEATGFFYVTKIDDRWWMVDPEGYLTINMGIVALSPGSTPNEKAGQQRVYGDDKAWAEGVTRFVKDELGFNSTGAWSSDQLLRQVEDPITYTKLEYFLVGYGDMLGVTVQESGHKGFTNNTMPVFDPGFEVFADQKAAALASQYKDDPYLVGYYSDNELPTTINMLDNYLKLDPNDITSIFSYTTAWEWFRQRRGPNATINDITPIDRDDFREFVYDRYYSVVSKALKKYDPNHMYLGSRLHSEAKTSPGIMRAAGRYCDAISLNYYNEWTPVLQNMADWEKWSGKPVIITEWYVKAMDSGLPNTSGAGWIVPTQKDRGYFYQHFALGLLESKSCVGWHWFKYKDNDINAPASDPSNIDGNKGIINTNFEVYTDLTDQMKIFNYNVYNIIEYLDNN